ncbi:peroxiredoxin family protein [Desulfosarcina cetonica]|uniref:peroxiredoxin family protein n=1 Tax=Desulfosarcina cetonica TaxID=90730 RepID=UPI0006D13876|nr:redoxin domain-containing protein [Desulfosarcina cetonica]
MRKKKIVWWAGILAAILFCSPPLMAGAPITAGQTAPDFTLKDAQGTPFVLSALKNHQMAVLYFFNAGSRPSQEGLTYLNNLKKKYFDSNLVVWAVTMSPADKVTRYVKQTTPAFPVLLDGGTVSDLYGARTILPSFASSARIGR